jgi:hypothetical protein
MNSFKMILLLLRRGLLILLILYWVSFIGFTVDKFVVGGPRAVVGYYVHLAGAAFNWRWRVFLAQQIVLLAVTLALCFLELRPSKPSGPDHTS